MTREELNRHLEEFKSRGGQTKVLSVGDQALFLPKFKQVMQNRVQRLSQDESRKFCALVDLGLPTDSGLKTGNADTVATMTNQYIGDEK